MSEGARILYVEGKNDAHAICHVMEHYGVTCSIKTYRTDNPSQSEAPTIAPLNSVDEVLKSIEVAVPAMAGGAVGFVIDADTDLQARWAAIRGRLERVVEVEIPDKPPSKGFNEISTKFKTRVGVWLMPDNRVAGILEDFLEKLVDDGDDILRHAQEATDTAKQKGAKFPDAHHQKAVIHAWLAWQENPGLPFGTAITARYLRADRPAGRQFAHWFAELFQLELRDGGECV